jgi:hypothetical protein
VKSLKLLATITCLVASTLNVEAAPTRTPSPPTSLTINGGTPTPPTPPPRPPVGNGYLPGAYNQMSYQGTPIVEIDQYSAKFSGTDTVTGFTQPRATAIWGGAPANPNLIQLIQNNPGDQTRQILTGGIMAPCGAPALPGCGRTENFYRNTLVAPYDGSIYSQNQLIHWPAGGNVGKMYYHRQWMRLPANFLSLVAGSFFTISENKTADTMRTGIGINAYGGSASFYLSADQAGYGPYTLYWQDNFDPSTYPIPVNTWFLMEFATRPSAGSDGFVWAAINGKVLRGPFSYQSVPYTYAANGAHTGPTRPYDADVNRIFVNMSYSNAARPMTVDIARSELWESFPPDATMPHP